MSSNFPVPAEDNRQGSYKMRGSGARQHVGSSLFRPALRSTGSTRLTWPSPLLSLTGPCLPPTLCPPLLGRSSSRTCLLRLMLRPPSHFFKAAATSPCALTCSLSGNAPGCSLGPLRLLVWPWSRISSASCSACVYASLAQLVRASALCATEPQIASGSTLGRAHAEGTGPSGITASGRRTRLCAKLGPSWPIRRSCMVPPAFVPVGLRSSTCLPLARGLVWGCDVATS